VIHDAANGYSGFGLADLQILGFAGSTAMGYFAAARFLPVPFDPTIQKMHRVISAATEQGSDAFRCFSWVHTFNLDCAHNFAFSSHFNRADFESDPHDFPTASDGQSVLEVCGRASNSCLREGP